MSKMRKYLDALEGIDARMGGFQVETIPTGIASFDQSTGVGGVPRRRLSLFVGREGSGKTMLLLSLIARAQQEGGDAAFVDAEHALTPGFAELLGVDYDKLVVVRPSTLEQCYDALKEFASSGMFDVAGFDSAVALPTVHDLHLSASDSTRRAGQASVHSSELKKLTALCDDRTAVVVTNQMRLDPNSYAGGVRWYQPGGKALGFYASLRTEVRIVESIRDSQKRRIGHRAKTIITKNKVAPPFGESEFVLKYESGIDYIHDVIKTALETGTIEKRGPWYYLWKGTDSEMKWQGRAALEKDLADSPELVEALEDE